MTRRILGAAILATPYIALLTLGGMKFGFLLMAAIFGFVAVLAGSIVLGVWLLDS